MVINQAYFQTTVGCVHLQNGRGFFRLKNKWQMRRLYAYVANEFTLLWFTSKPN